jgi:hypothetical protein
MSHADTLATAYTTEHGVQAICPTTGETYISTVVRRLTWDGRKAAVACVCACCDAHLRIGEACDPKEPQWHVYFLGEA